MGDVITVSRNPVRVCLLRDASRVWAVILTTVMSIRVTIQALPEKGYARTLVAAAA
jgi:hypothetical protein